MKFFEQNTRGRVVFYRYKPLINILTTIIGITPRWLREGMWTITQGWRGRMGLAVRYAIAQNSAKRCGEVVYIGPNVEIRDWKNLEIGSNVSIHRGCYIDAIGGVSIGSDISIAHGTSVLSSNHSYDDLEKPIRDNPVIFEKTCIMDDVWIGCGCKILAGTSIGSRCVVAAGAVVVKSVPANSLVGGIPAKIIKSI